jgi:hypothetical protein
VGSEKWKKFQGKKNEGREYKFRKTEAASSDRDR